MTTSWADAINKLTSLGYRITLDGEELRYAYQGNGPPAQEKITPLLEVLKVHKREILSDPYFLIEQTLEEINRGWQPGTLPRMKVNRPDEWGKMLTLERRINGMALGGNLDGLRGVLNEYQSLILAMVKEFKSLNENEGQGMFNFVERPKSPGAGERQVE